MKIKQRRLFFQAAKSTDSQNRSSRIPRTAFRLCGRIVAIFAALLFFGCASLTPDRVALLAQIAGQAAQIGAQNWLAKHPDQKQLFNDVIAAITALVQAGITNQQAYVEQLHRLPTTTLAGPEGSVVVKTDHLVITDKVADKATVLTEPATMPVVKATLSGLRKGCTPLPPVPVVVVSPVKRPPPRGTPTPTVKSAPPLSDQELNRQFEEFLKQKKR